MPEPRLPAPDRARAIVQATITVFARGGSHGATTREIAKAAGVSEALVFRHFPTKDSLYRAVLEAKIAEADRNLPLDESLDQLSDRAFFLKIATLFLERAENDEAFLRLFLFSALEGNELSREFYRGRTERLISAIERRLALIFRRDGRPADLDAAGAARAFFSLAFGAVMARTVLEDPKLRQAEPGKLAEILVSVFFSGITPGAESP